MFTNKLGMIMIINADSALTVEFLIEDVEDIVEQS